MKIRIESIPHKEQRYETMGDWYEDADGVQIRVSECSEWKAEWMLGIHELIEMFLCKAGYVSPADVDEFDMTFRGKGEPGDDPNAPYHDAHNVSTGIERILCSASGLKWKEYNDILTEAEKKCGKKRKQH